MLKLSNAVLVATLVLAAPARAHVVLEQRNAPAASYYKAVFMVGHGCEGSPTRSITVEIPDGVVNIKPMPKPGWEVRTRIEKLAKPYELHGKTFTEGVTQVTWTGGPLLDAHFDEFVMMTRLPDSPGTLWFKVVQACEQGENRWVETPGEGKSAHDHRMPAAQLEVVPVEDHKHH
ncbi:MAG TPA: YcnI family protein [Burkholderiales bacterium]|nr:YcnI family protein [Burkholderiales bacterium]